MNATATILLAIGIEQGPLRTVDVLMQFHPADVDADDARVRHGDGLCGTEQEDEI